MKFQFTLIVLTSLLSASFSFAATVADVTSNLSAITQSTNTLDSQIVAFPNSGGSITAGQAIHAGILAIALQVSKVTSLANTLPKPVSQSDGASILTGLQALETALNQAIRDLVAKKSALAALTGIRPLVMQDLKNLKAMAAGFETAVIYSLPNPLFGSAAALESQIIATLASAVDVFSL